MSIFQTEITESINLSELVEEFKKKHSDAMYYMESILEYKIGKLESSTEIPDNFDFLRFFSEDEEWKIKKYPSYYRIVKLDKTSISQEKRQSRTLMIDDSAKKNRNLPFKYLIIEMIEDGELYFESWKGVSG
ncbi:hypothetical protein NST62_02135 [Ureibacillus sp. FSL K6-8385]|uniref:Uncharacterized protein n=1 Tax=Ureibacillus terrenus TaxID=118246 RepID=A0A540V401_9BACL|nr:hypothetical protein [Ureibacillus terrenus]MED3660548.1 hypothetical protein [Ureibacillus terrenus]TQE91461.1 hypothetical protein FKZ59_05655 [Ureibacillus terrenus]